MNYSLHFCKIAAPCESAWASNWTAIDGAIQSPAILPAGWGCIVTRNGSIAAVLGRNAGWVPWSIRIFRKRGKLYGPNGYGHGKTRHTREFPSSGKLSDTSNHVKHLVLLFLVLTVIGRSCHLIPYIFPAFKKYMYVARCCSSEDFWCSICVRLTIYGSRPCIRCNASWQSDKPLAHFLQSMTTFHVCAPWVLFGLLGHESNITRVGVTPWTDLWMWDCWLHTRNTFADDWRVSPLCTSCINIFWSHIVLQCCTS